MSEWFRKLLGLENVKSLEEAHLEWENAPDLWVIVLLIIPAVLAFAYFIYRRERKDAAPAAKKFLAVIRTLILLLIILLLFGPKLAVDQIITRSSFVVVLIDESDSMKLHDKLTDKDSVLKIAKVTGISSEKGLTAEQDEQVRKLTRMDLVKKVLLNPQIKLVERLEKDRDMKDTLFNIQFYGFSSEIRARDKAGLDQIEAAGNVTSIGNAIHDAVAAMKNQYISAIVVFSDGKNNYGRDPLKEAQGLDARGIPIYTVLAGIPAVPRDIELKDLELPDSARLKDKVRVRFKVNSFGYDRENSVVSLYQYKIDDPKVKLSQQPHEIEKRIQAAKKVAEHAVTLSGKLQAEDFVFTPETLGEFELILAIPEREGEITNGNNYLTHKIRIIDDKIKVLYIEGQPRWEYRFLTNALKRDHSIQFQAFLYSADFNFPNEASQGLQPLTEIPSAIKDLVAYDVIIIGDVDPRWLAQADWEKTARNIESFVTEYGGGIIFISGFNFNPRSYKGTPLGNLLPVLSEDEYFLQENVNTFGYKMTPAGKEHDIVRLEPDRDKNIELWEDNDNRGDGLPGIYWLAKTRAKPGVFNLVQVPVAAGSREGLVPLFACSKVGSGGTFFSATDDLWLWRKFVGDKYEYRLWRNAIDWVAKDKLMGTKRFRIKVDKDRYAMGETVKIYATARTRDMNPDERLNLDVMIEPPDRITQIPVKLSQSDKAKPGSYIGTYHVSSVGEYRIWVGDPDDEHSRAYADFSVIVPNLETHNPEMDPEMMEKIAGTTREHGGIYLTLDKVNELPEKVKRSKHTQKESKDDDLWDAPLIYILFALLITTEWIFRKINRLL